MTDQIAGAPVREGTTINKNDFIDISIRGRVAYAICCLENTIKSRGYSIKDWTIVLQKEKYY